MKFLSIALVLLITLFQTTMVAAQTLPQPKGPVILTITGNIKNTNDGATAKFDRDMLEALGMRTIITTTPWHEGKTTFEGVSFKTLLETIGAEGSIVHAFALNDYETNIPVDDANDESLIIALKLNGNYMGVRDKGPIFVIYPYDSRSEYHTQTYYARSAWQVVRMTVE